MIVPILALALQGAQPAQAWDYVPDTGWHDDAWARSFYERWFGGQLRAMREPPLATGSDLGGFSERLRMLVLPTFRPAYAYRVDFRADGSAALRWARLNGRGGYAPGRLARQRSRALAPHEVRRLKEALAAAALGSLPREEPLAPADADGTEDIGICVDGTGFVFEHLSVDGRHFLSRSCGIEEERLRRLGETIIGLKLR